MLNQRVETCEQTELYKGRNRMSGRFAVRGSQKRSPLMTQKTRTNF